MSTTITEVEKIAQALNEPNVALIAIVVEILGLERTLAFLAQTIEVEQQGGMLTTDQDRRRTMGGVFFRLIKKNVTAAERKAIFPILPQKQRSKTTTKMKAQPIAWAEAIELVDQVIRTPGEATKVKITLIGRPLKVIAHQSCVVVSLKGKPPKPLPNGLPPVPAGSAITWAVFIANKHWAKVRISIERNQEDALIVEGYPIVGKNGIAAVMASNCKSVLMERAQREQVK